jgi:hypothetical protein
VPTVRSADTVAAVAELRGEARASAETGVHREVSATTPAGRAGDRGTPKPSGSSQVERVAFGMCEWSSGAIRTFAPSTVVKL